MPESAEVRLSPFAEALRGAIRQRGATLERLAEHLRDKGTPVSLATLSYWQSGRSQPERAVSLAALRNVERFLGMRSGELAGLLDAPRPRGRLAHRVPTPVPMSKVWPDARSRHRALDGLSPRDETRLTRLSIVSRLEIGPDRTERHQWNRNILRAEEDGVSSMVLLFWADSDQPPPVLVPTRNCSIVALNQDEEAGLAAAELQFPRPLVRHETIIVEYEIEQPGSLPATNHERRGRMPTREMLIEVKFDPRALPARCEQFSEIGDRHLVRPLTWDDTYTVHALGLDLRPGAFGIRWEW
ncbi:transcriptional regulator with XRE-family HTH domain [Saccharothrix tamanrassetensis]|uniref:Transcriptional regulator with XRE-family HTH domain n=1 Tax=Saccharothrix tamanrassetensis TaxID=1051531 RepID=A0A841CIE0_9PSEU|nr:helix-turn-helix transcriptional regulator [Saccharothrix tamanrassetensis]MBB5955897.1 transcriptional regulator with XRE-family HTH domain [Saccharothrix tamanrassetensis]